MAKKKPTKPETPAVRPDVLPEGYDQFLGSLKERIRRAQLGAAVSVNRELVLLYWEMGRDILARQEERGWGAKVIDRLAADLKRAFPEMAGFSPRNLKYMRAFAAAWPEEPIVQQLAAQIPWFHNCVLLDKVKEHEERAWYVRKALEHGWSRSVLVLLGVIPLTWDDRFGPIVRAGWVQPGAARPRSGPTRPRRVEDRCSRSGVPSTESTLST